VIQFITVIHVIVCVLLVLVVLLQQGKKDGMGAAFGGGSSSVFGARGAETFLEKFTKVLAVIFMSTSLSLVYFSSRESSGSLLSNEKAATESPTVPGEPAKTAEPATGVTAESTPEATKEAVKETVAQPAPTAPLTTPKTEKAASNKAPSK
jgi:preprotein translocase subunit SecG